MKTILLSLGNVALVDDANFDRLSQFRWRPAKSGKRCYAIRNVKRKEKWTSARMHLDILAPPAGKEIDHKDGNGLNNQKSNLRFVTRSQNCMNRVSVANKTGFKGVCFDGRGRPKPFWARLRTAELVYQSAYFKTAIEAAAAYNSLASKHFGEYAKLNYL